MKRANLETLSDAIRELTDPRKPRGIRHGYAAVMTIALGAVLCGARSYTAIAEWGQRLTQSHLARIRARFNPRTGRYQAPSESTIRRTLQSADVEEAERIFGRWLMAQSAPDDPVSVDGKTVRGARRPDGSQLHLLSAFLQRSGVTVAQREVGAKTNEIPELKPMLQELDLEGRVVTADALHTQKDTARFIVEDKKADFVFTVKDNQPTLREDIALLEESAFPPSG